MKHLSLFSGMGGFDLAAELMGWDNVAHCEWNPFCQKILKYYWPNAISYEDITKTDFSIHRGNIDILTGGFPCQPYSVAGKRKGKEDERHLWPEMLRAIREIQPRWIVGENVLGLVGWNGGLVFEEVQADLEAEGYEVQAFILPAAGVGAPHRRYRVWFVAHSASNRRLRNRQGAQAKNRESQPGNPGVMAGRPEGLRFQRDASDSSIKGLPVTSCRKFGEIQRSEKSSKRSKFSGAFAKGNEWSNFPTQSPVCDGNDGFSARLDGITFYKWRKESIKSGGNAIVPKLALQIFKSIQEYENTTANRTSHL